MSTRHAPRGMVCSVDHLASSAGVGVLADGGSAVDAAVATSAVLSVTSPHLCGMGGDLFALVHHTPGEPPATLLAGGYAGSGADPDRLRAEGRTAMPFELDVRSVTVPGCVDGWLALHQRFGRLPLARVLGPAISYARDGFAASPLFALALLLLDKARGADALTAQMPCHAGQLVVREGVARALDDVVDHGRAGFYGGEFGAGLLAVGDGEFVEADLARVQAEWVAPISARVFGHDVWTTPPPTQGYLTLLGSAIAEGLPLPDSADDGLWAHLHVESARAAGHDRPALLHEAFDPASVLADSEVARRRDLVDPQRRSSLPAPARAGDTTYLCAGDAGGMAVSLIQSNAKAFGSLLFEPATGIGLHNRGIGFSLEPGHPAEYGPGRRPPHTLCPAVVTEPDGTLRHVLGTMGGDFQPQVVSQLLCRLLRHGASPGAAVDAPRAVLFSESGFDIWDTPDRARVRVEASAPPAWVDALQARGHDLDVAPDADVVGFGHAHVITATPDGWAGAADPRAVTGAAAGL